MSTVCRYEIAILGAGRVGQTLGRLLARAGHRITRVVGRSRATAAQAVAFIGSGEPGCVHERVVYTPPSILFVTTPDGAIAATAADLAAQQASWQGMIVLHCSGALSSLALQALVPGGAATGSMHPLHAFGTPLSQPDLLQGVYWCLEGDPAATSVARHLVTDLRGQASEIRPEQKILYHAAAAMAGNLLTGLMSLSFDLLEQCGIAPAPARAMLLRLSEGVLQRIQTDGEITALAGPISRGDTQTVAQHLQVLQTLPPVYLDVYRSVSRQLVTLAQQKGVSAADLAGIQHLLHRDTVPRT